MTTVFEEQSLNGDVTQPKQGMYETSATQNYRLGTRWARADGRVFHYASANASAALVRGDVIQSAVSNSIATEQVDMTIATSSAVGDDFAYATIKTDTTTGEDFFKDGWYIVSDDVVASGGASIYQIKSHPAIAAASGKFTFYDKINVQILAGQKAGIITNPYKLCVQLPTTITGFPVGVAPIAVPVSEYFWLQTWGMANVLCKGAVTVGEDVILVTTTAGSCDAQVAGAGSIQFARIGIGGSTIATTDWGFVYLQIAP